MNCVMERREGREAFGGDPTGYLAGRPDYPDRLYTMLGESGCLGGTRSVFEIGPGAGQITGRLLDLGVGHLTAIEPDHRLIEFLAARFAPQCGLRLSLQAVPFESAILAGESFDLGIAGTSFHWLDPQPALEKIFRALRPGGWWVACWNVFMDPNAVDPFIEATEHLFAPLRKTPAVGQHGKPSFALDVTGRLAELEAAGFKDIRHEVLRRELIFTADQITALCRTFSQIAILPDDERETLLSSLRKIAVERFHGSVKRAILTPIYIARRP